MIKLTIPPYVKRTKHSNNDEEPAVVYGGREQIDPMKYGLVRIVPYRCSFINLPMSNDKVLENESFGIPEMMKNDSHLIYFINARPLYVEYWGDYLSRAIGYIFHQNQLHPEWFSGNSPESFDNRESVINLAFHFLTHDWYSLFKSATIRGEITQTQVNFIADTLRSLDMNDSIKPRYPQAHYVNMFSTCANDGESAPVVRACVADFDRVVEGQPNPDNTFHLVRNLLVKGGTTALIEFLAIAYGPYFGSNNRRFFTREKESGMPVKFA